MEETFEGTFYFNNEKQDWCVKFVKSNGKEAVIKCNQDQISSNLPQNKDEEIEVKFETDKRYYREILNIRSKNETENEAVMSGKYVSELKIQKDQEEKAAENKPPRPDGDFHNPYNFIPTPPRDITHPELGDHAPSGHDRYISEKLSGKLTVKITVKTPLVVLDTARMSVNSDDKTHKEFPIRIENGKPFINPTAVKGMLRSAYEAVTNSRMSVFTKHEDRLAFRMESTEGAMSVPARVENGEIVLYTGTTQIDSSGKPPQNGVLCSAWLPTYDKQQCRISNNAVKISDDNNRVSEHGEKVWANLEKFQHYRWNKYSNPPRYVADFKYWRVVGNVAKEKSNLITPNKTQPIDVPNSRRGNSFHTSLGENLKVVSGYVCITGNNQGDRAQTSSNIDNKHDERLFFNENSSSGFPKFSLAEVEAGWNDLIKNYRVEHDNGNGRLDEAPKATRKKSDGTKYEINLQWSRHIRQTTKSETERGKKLKLEELKEESLVYARLGKDGNILEIYPVTISRRIHQVSPDDLLENTNLKPEKSIDELSPADRVFGWVGKGVSKNGNYRGQIRFGSVVLTEDSANKPIDDIIQKFGQESNPDSWLPLNILGQPKPQQGRFYVARNKNGDAQVDGLNNENAGYNLPSVKGLRGRKVYPHHAKLPDDYWTIQNNLREYIRPDREQDSQNRSIEGWIKPKTEFQFDIHFTNLSEVEIGVLIWLLSLNGENENKYFHRFGGGKPYGFGSVKLEIIESDVREGKDLKTFYLSLEDEKIGKLDENAIKNLANEFKKLADSIFPTIIKSFLCACEGFSDKPTHYPRKSLNLTADTKSFEWFVENNRIERGTVKHGYVLQDLVNDDGLPYFD